MSEAKLIPAPGSMPFRSLDEQIRQIHRRAAWWWLIASVIMLPCIGSALWITFRRGEIGEPITCALLLMLWCVRVYVSIAELRASNTQGDS